MFSITTESRFDRDQVIHRAVIFRNLTLVEASLVLRQVKEKFTRLYMEGIIAGVQDKGPNKVRAIAIPENLGFGERGITVDYYMAEMNDTEEDKLVAIESCLLIDLDDPTTLSS